MSKLHIQPAEFVPWVDARFRTEEARDRFLIDITNRQTSEVEAQAIPNESLGARVRWLPGQFLGLNDLAYAYGGRIVFTAPRRRGA